MMVVSFQLLGATAFIVVVVLSITSTITLVEGVKNKCGPSLKLNEATDSCEPLNNEDIMRAIHFLANPPKSAKCEKIRIVQDLAVCEDHLNYNQCEIWSTITSQNCDHFGSLEFEKYFAEKGCTVILYHFPTMYKGNVCNTPVGKLATHPNLEIRRIDMWAKKCFNCFYNYIPNELKEKMKPSGKKIDILKLQGREGVYEDFDGVQYTILSDLYLHLKQEILATVNQIVLNTAINTRTLTDTVGREAEMAWNMWASQQLLNAFGGAFFVNPELGPSKEQPWQFTHLLEQADVNPMFGNYRTSYIRYQSSSTGSGSSSAVSAVQTENDNAYQTWKPKWKTTLKGIPPGYCTVPSTEEDEKMQKWIQQELNARCHPTRLWVPCVRDRGYDAIIPCPQELMNNLAEDYAISKLWCNFEHKAANIQPLTKVDKGAKEAFSQPSFARGKGVRLAFFFTVYTDANFVKRLLTHLYSSQHYYLLHIDPAGSSYEFERDLREYAKNHTNVFLAKDVPIVYGASTATILLTRAMAWFHHHAKGWDYFVPITGSDYPLLPLHRIEKIFMYQNPPMPFVMGWTPGTSTHIFRLQKTHPVFELHPLLVKSIKAVTDERGAVLGAVPMEYRSSNFGPPLFCNNQSTFYHLDNRLNKTGKYYDTMWLFPRDTFPGRGRAYAEENRAFATPSFDQEWRVWKKSDPATTGAYDRESVEYIVTSIEGKKYWHFFKHMLLGSEEHYYISLLYNWPRTKSFVQTLSAQIVWNTWELGLWEVAAGFQTHTHFLSMNEWDIIKGFSMRGMMFARKFSTKKTAALLDKIDQEILFNQSTDAGLYWPGFYEVDITSPGKIWVANYRRNHLQNKKNALPENWLAMGEHVGPIRVIPSAVSSEDPTKPRSMMLNQQP